MSHPQHHTRRSFLSGRAAVDALGEVAQEAAREGFAPALPLQSLQLRVQRRAMACDFVVQFPARRDDDTTEHAVAALDLIEALEDQLTVYRADSEIIRINQTAAEAPVQVEARLFRLLQLAATIHRDTNGASDQTVGPLSRVWGFSRRAGRMPSENEISAALELVGFRHVRLDEKRQSIAFTRRGIEINLNSIGKGYALDRGAELLDARGVANYLFHGGKSSVLARGRPDDSCDGWTIGLRHPLWPAKRLGELRLRDEALGTSGAATQSFRHRGRRYGHILDPRTGWPVEGIFTATVIAPTAAEADALSTAFYVMGPDQVAAYCATRPHIRAVLVCPAEREGEVVVHALNLDEDTWRTASPESR